MNSADLGIAVGRSSSNLFSNSFSTIENKFLNVFTNWKLDLDSFHMVKMLYQVLFIGEKYRKD